MDSALDFQSTADTKTRDFRQFEIPSGNDQNWKIVASMDRSQKPTDGNATKNVHLMRNLKVGGSRSHIVSVSAVTFCSAMHGERFNIPNKGDIPTTETSKIFDPSLPHKSFPMTKTRANVAKIPKRQRSIPEVLDPSEFNLAVDH